MKINSYFRLAFVIMIFCTLTYSCKKDSSSGAGANTTETQTQADDQAMASNEDEAVTNDAEIALNSSTAITGSARNGSNEGSVTVDSYNGQTTNVSALNSLKICDATVSIDTASDPRSITITYDGSNCWGNRTRTGKIVITMPKGVHWRDKGASVTIIVLDLKITRKRDGKSITINGAKTYTNESGGLLIDLATLGSVTHTISSDFTIAYDNGTQRTWNVEKKRVFSYDNGLVITTIGTHTDGTNNGIAEWGTNRNGVSFESLITVPKVIRQDCDFRLVSGENKIIRSDNISTTITYGLDVSGSPTTCPGTGNYYYKAVWVGPNGKTVTIIAPY